MTDGKKALLMAVVGVGVLCTMVFAVMILSNADKKRVIANQQAGATPITQTLKEYDAQVVSTPLIATGSGKIAYAVYVKELGGARCLDATQCPLLENGQWIVIENPGLSEWYTFVRFAK